MMQMARLNRLNYDKIAQKIPGVAGQILSITSQYSEAIDWVYGASHLSSLPNTPRE